VERNLAELMDLYERGAIMPRIDRVFALRDAVAALAAVADRSVAGKVVVRVQD
jgi:NADPH:quinone reductase-like Zn-dependent oxidoreductase